MEWSWMEGSVLHSCNEYTPPREIFQAVCDELGRYYTAHGKKYAKSSHTIKWKGKHLKYQLKFNSSGSNLRGDWVCLEIVANIWALDAQGMERKGILDFPTTVGVAPVDAKKIKIVKVDGSIEEREPEDGEDIEVFFSRTCNIYGIDLKLFEKIITYIDGIIKKAELYETREGIDSYLKTLPEYYLKFFWKDSNSVQYYNQLTD